MFAFGAQMERKTLREPLISGKKWIVQMPFLFWDRLLHLQMIRLHFWRQELKL